MEYDAVATAKVRMSIRLRYRNLASAAVSRLVNLIRMIERRIRWYDDPDVAEADIREHYRCMTPQARLDEMVELLNLVGKWNERRLTRVARLIKFGER
jgi:hypothetical protein